MYRPAVVRFYFDADVLGLAHTVCRLRSDATYPGDPGGAVQKRMRGPCVIESPSVKDPVWIPTVAAQGWLIITRDSQILDHLAEISAVRVHGAKMVTLAARDAGSTWGQLEVLMRQWRAIERLLDQPGPFVYTATRTTLRPINLGSPTPP